MRHLLVESSHSFTSESLPEESTYLPFLRIYEGKMLWFVFIQDLENVTEDMADPSCAWKGKLRKSLGHLMINVIDDIYMRKY